MKRVNVDLDMPMIGNFVGRWHIEIDGIQFNFDLFDITRINEYNTQYYVYCLGYKYVKDFTYETHQRATELNTMVEYIVETLNGWLSVVHREDEAIKLMDDAKVAL